MSTTTDTAELDHGAARALLEELVTSYRALPVWVQCWVAWLVGINVVAGLDRSTPTGRAVFLSTNLFSTVNTALLVRERGWGRSLAFAHLAVWPFLVVRLVRRLREDDLAATERTLATLVVVTNCISLAFDVVDAARWLGGDRDVARP